MGSRTDAEIAAWQEQAGIKPATGERAHVLHALSEAAYQAIKVIELESSGIRDGNGYWHGADVIGGIAGDLTALCSRLLKSYGELPQAKPAPAAETRQPDGAWVQVLLVLPLDVRLAVARHRGYEASRHGGHRDHYFPVEYRSPERQREAAEWSKGWQAWNDEQIPF